MVDALERFEHAVQSVWARHVFSVGDSFDSDAATQLRMLRLGWSLLRVLTWPADVGRALEAAAESLRQHRQPGGGEA